MTVLPAYPVTVVLEPLLQALRDGPNAVLVAPPGAGKTTLVPLALLDEQWLAGRKLLVLEPRRLAARRSAERMAELLGETVGQRVGYAMRFERRIGPATRIELVTQGLLTRRLQRDADLADVAGVIFDEFHERSLDADLGLALCLDVQRSIRPDLRLLAMSATLDGAAVARLLGDAPLIVSEGRQFPVETVFLGRPAGRLEDAVAQAAKLALAEREGDILVFLPGAAEIRFCASRLARDRPANVLVAPLYGELGSAAQDRALVPAPGGCRKIVLATNIAETSLTIEGVRVVIDAGLARVQRYSARTGMSRLETVQASRAAAGQRRGRAGRTAPGACYRLWSEAEDRGLTPATSPEIAEADLAPLALELAAWGIADPAQLSWPDPPPAGAFARGRALLAELGALDGDGRISAHGRAMADLPLHPRLAHMVLVGRDDGEAATAIALAALLSGRDPLRGDPDIQSRLRLLLAGTDKAADTHALANWRRVVRQLHRLLDAPNIPVDPSAAGQLLAAAFPDRIAQRRPGSDGLFKLAGGRGARVAADDPLAAAGYIVAAEIEDSGTDAWIRLAAGLDAVDVERLPATTASLVVWDERTAGVRAEVVRSIGEIRLGWRPLASPDASLVTAALLDGIRRHWPDAPGWTDSARRLQARVAFLRRSEPDAWPDLGDAALRDGLDTWLQPHLSGMSQLAQVRRLDLAALLGDLLDWPQRQRLDRLAPTHVALRSGARLAVDYTQDPPTIAARMQQFFGTAETPRIRDGLVPLTLHLLAPGGQPLQVTSDLAGFWRGSYAAIRREMRGRYPKHHWPADPVAAPPVQTARAARALLD